MGKWPYRYRFQRRILLSPKLCYRLYGQTIFERRLALTAIELDDYQLKALDKLKNGNILVGGVGSGKSRTGLAYFYQNVCGGSLSDISGLPNAKNLYIITTARKRDKKEWDDELVIFDMYVGEEDNPSEITVTVDSWNNIDKYAHIKDSFFLFDEQRVVGSGVWAKTFIKLAKANEWILLTATPADVWLDLIPVFVANGFYKNRTEFIRRHVVYNNFSKFPKVDHYVEVYRLIRLRDSITVIMHYQNKTIHNPHDVIAPFDKVLYDQVNVSRWNVYEKQPVRDVSEMCYLLRRVVNSDARRVDMVASLLTKHPKAIIFYNFNYERDLLLELAELIDIPIAEWNGHKHEDIPKTDSWMYIVQYAAGAEGWNCIDTDTIIFYSQNYSYKATIQAAGRIDRRNTPFKELHYYYVRSNAQIDQLIKKAFNAKRNFNESMFRDM